MLIKNCIVGGEKQSILIGDGCIAEIGDVSETSGEVIDAEGKLAISGFANCHTHLPMTMFKGIADDVPLDEWLKKYVWPAEEKYVNNSFCYTGALLGCAELIRSGTTSFVDMYFHVNAVAGAVKESGLRAFLGSPILDAVKGSLKIAEKFVKAGKKGMIAQTVAPHSIYTCSEETLLKSKELADKYSALIQIHVSETREEVKQCIKEKGKRPVEYLDEIGFLGPNVLAMHCVHLNKKEIDILHKRRVSVVHCPSSNMKLASGIAPVKEMLNKGINICLGTDGSASNNSLDLFGEMKTAALLQKVKEKDARALPAKQALQMATENAYKALKLNNGLYVGCKADIVLLDMKKPNMVPMRDWRSNIVYSANSSNVDTVIVGGRVLMQGGEIKIFDEQEIIQKANELFYTMIGSK